MEREFIQAPWVILENDPVSTDYVLAQNNLNRKRWRFLKRVYGTPLGKNCGPEIISFLKAERLVTSLGDIIPMLEEEARYHLHGFSKNEQTATIIPTHACNFGCPYCYNKNIRDPQNETRLHPDEMVKKLVSFYLNSPARNWILHVIGGGEPLLASEYIVNVASVLRKISEENGCSFELDIVTNGYLLHGKLLENLLKAGLRKVRVTMDPEHDKTRPFSNGEPTFNKILSNLKALPEEVELQLGSNVPVGKIKEFSTLLEKLTQLKERVTDFNVSLILKPLKNEAGRKQNGSSRMYGPKETDYLLSLVKMLDDAGFQRKVRYPRIECEAGRSCEKLVMNMRGETTCCAGLDGLKEYRTELTDGVVKGSMNYRVMNDESWKAHCFTNGAPCAYLPLCHAGCRLISISKGMGWWTINCEKPYLDSLTRYELKRWGTCVH